MLELPCTLEESELCTRLGDDGVAAAPHTGVDVRARGAVCALGDDGAAAAPHTGADACARGAVYALGVFYTVMSFNEASEDTGFFNIFPPAAVCFCTDRFVFSFSPAFLCIFRTRGSVRIMGVRR